MKSLNSLIESFETQGVAEQSLDSPKALYHLQNHLIDWASQYLNAPIKNLGEIHHHLNPDLVNEFRLSAIQKINQLKEVREDLLNQTYPFLAATLGPDIVVQKNFNLVLNVPKDPYSIIPLHTDTLTGHSVFEITAFIPLTPITSEDQMFIMKYPQWDKHRNLFNTSSNTLQQRYEIHRKEFWHMELNPGNVLYFWHHLPHGNYINQTQQTHWSLNLRFKALFSPYGEKQFSHYFMPWKLSKITERALKETTL